MDDRFRLRRNNQATLSCNLLLLIGIPWLLTGVAPAVAQSGELPDEFEIQTYASGFEEPVAIEQAPDGRLFVAEKGGRVWTVSNGQKSDTPFASLEAYTVAECGLLGLALDPNFAENGQVFLFRTISADEQQIIRLTDNGGVGEDLTIIRDNLPTAGFIHNGGGLKFGPDGKLYFAIGDNGNDANGQSLTTLAGTVCRINSDGSVPDDNPLTTPTGSRRATYAYGFRNPFRFCFASDGRLFVADVGSNGDARREEINLVEPGANYGWPEVEGFGGSGEFRDPLIAYREEGSCVAGCAIYEADQFPAEYRGDLFHVDYTSHGVFRVRLQEDALATHELFYQGERGPVDLTVANDGSLFYAEMFSGAIKRISVKGAAGGGDPGNGNENGNSSDGGDDPGDTPTNSNGNDNSGDMGPDEEPSDNGAGDDSANDESEASPAPSTAPLCGFGFLPLLVGVSLTLIARRNR